MLKKRPKKGWKHTLQTKRKMRDHWQAMRDSFPIQNKICPKCGKNFVRRIEPRGILEAYSDFIKRKFCSRKCFLHSENNSKKDRYLGQNNPRWKGGKISIHDGYTLSYCPTHPFASRDKYILTHRLVMENWLKKHDPNNPYLLKVNGFEEKWLSPATIVHHINEKPWDNRIGNLFLFPNNSSHRKFHCSTK